MPLQAPTRRLMHHVGLEFVEKKVSGHGHRSLNAGLSLTSMIDFLVVTVVFLLMTFSASGETPIAKGLNLPKAENTLDMIDAPIVAITGSYGKTTTKELTAAVLEAKYRVAKTPSSFNTVMGITRAINEHLNLKHQKPTEGDWISEIHEENFYLSARAIKECGRFRTRSATPIYATLVLRSPAPGWIRLLATALLPITPRSSAGERLDARSENKPHRDKYGLLR